MLVGDVASLGCGTAEDGGASTISAVAPGDDGVGAGSGAGFEDVDVVEDGTAGGHERMIPGEISGGGLGHDLGGLMRGLMVEGFTDGGEAVGADLWQAEDGDADAGEGAGIGDIADIDIVFALWRDAGDEATAPGTQRRLACGDGIRSETGSDVLQTPGFKGLEVCDGGEGIEKGMLGVEPLHVARHKQPNQWFCMRQGTAPGVTGDGCVMKHSAALAREVVVMLLDDDTETQRGQGCHAPGDWIGAPVSAGGEALAVWGGGVHGFLVLCSLFLVLGSWFLVSLPWRHLTSQLP